MANFNSLPSIVAQSTFTIETVTLGYFNSLPTAFSGEQFPINQASVDTLCDEFVKPDVKLLQPMEITRFGKVTLNTGGRHRGVSLEAVYSKEATVQVLVFHAATAEEVAARIIASNGSRRCTKGEQTMLKMAAKHEFGTVNYESITGLLYDNNGQSTGALTTKGALDKYVTLIALTLVAKVDNTLKVDVSHSLAKSIMTQVKKMKRRVAHDVVIPASYGKDGNVKTSEGVSTTYSTTNIIDEVIADKSRLDALLDAIVAVAKCAPHKGVLVPATVYDVATASKDGKSCIISGTPITDENGTKFHTVFNFADNVSRGAATYAALSALAIREEVTFSLEVLDADLKDSECDDEYADLDVFN